MALSVNVKVSSNPPYVEVNGLTVKTAPPIESLLRVIGTATRVDQGAIPAPPKHRNNQVHIFDSLGVDVVEHHYTRRADQIRVWLNVDLPEFRFTPRRVFAGNLILDGSIMPLNPTEAQFLKASPWKFDHFLAGFWHHKFNGFSVHIEATGPKLPSGRRSKTRIVTNVSISWPSEPWAKPPTED